MSTKETTIVDVLEQPDHYEVSVGMSYEQKNYYPGGPDGKFPLGGKMLLRFPNGNTFTFSVKEGRLVQQKTPEAPLAGPVNPDK
jgi:hypothetical protein